MTQEDSVALNDLSLKLAKHALPFDLIGPEIRFGPEIWAWQFLRMNEEYRAQFEYAQTNHLDYEDNKSRLLRFGMSDWLDPKLDFIPEEQFGSSRYFRPLLDPVEAIEWEIDFGYVEPQSQVPSYGMAHLPSFQERENKKISTAVWFAIDCSIPPLGQLKSAQELAKELFNWFKEEDLDPEPGHDALYSLLEIHECPYFDPAGFTSAAASIHKSDNPGEYWRAIRIDVFSGISRQIDSYKKPLEVIHRQYVNDGIADRPFLERLRFFFPDYGVDYGEHKSDGFALKALVVVEQLRRQGMSDQEIATFLTKNSCYETWTLGVKKNWVSDLASRIPIYRQHATRFIDDGYKWLIRAQKP